MKQISLLIRARKIQTIVQKHYEKERRDKCLHAIWENYVEDEFQINYHTFLRYVHTDTSELDRLIAERKRKTSKERKGKTPGKTSLQSQAKTLSPAKALRNIPESKETAYVAAEQSRGK